MANDNETLTFRIRAIAENMGAFKNAAKATDDVNNAMARSAKLADALTGANKKLTAARDKEQDAIGKVRVAEQKLAQVRESSDSKLRDVAAAEERVANARRAASQASNEAQKTDAAAARELQSAEQKLATLRQQANAKTSQLVASEERLATARRNSARASADADKIENDFKKLAERTLENNSQSSGTTSGKRWSLGFLNFFKGGEASNNFEKSGTLVGRTFGSGFGSGLESVLHTDAGPAVLAGLLAVVAVVSPAIGAVLAGGIVAAFGGGLAALGFIFAAKADAVKSKWQTTMAQVGADIALISKPFESVLIHIADVFQHTVDNFNPVLRSAFAGMAGPLSKFADDVGHALGRLVPAVRPIQNAFDKMLQSLGPGLDSAIHDIADGLIELSDSVSANPTGLGDFIAGIGHLTKELLEITTILNNADGAFRRLSGGTSLVTVVMDGLIGVVDIITTPLIILAKYISFVSDGINALTHNTSASGKSMSEAANSTVQLLQNLKKTGDAAHGAVPPLKDAHDVAVANATAAAAAAKKYEDWIAQLFALQNLAISVTRAEIGFKDAIATATAGIKDNGKTLSQNTDAGRKNYKNLLDAADAANTQTEAMIRNKSSLVDVAATSAKSREAFIKLAMQMGANRKTAEQLASQMIAIPNVSRRAVLTAQKQDLDSKLAQAKRQLADPNLTKVRRAQIEANIAKLQQALKKAQAQIDGLHGKTVPITYTVDGVNFTLNTKTPSSAGRATGGKIRGPGTGTSDTAGVYALSNQEYVVKAASASHYGDQAMDSVNRGTATIIPGMAKGGKVDSTVNIHGYNVFKNVAQLRKVLGTQFSPMVDAPGGGAGVQRWRAVALAALAAAHEPASWIGSLLSRMQRESGGNPRAINLWDSNAKRGTPSIGLMQTIGPTFAAYAGAYRGRGIYDPFANIYAAIRYTVARYGSGPAGWNRPGGYKNGGWLMPGQLAYNETRRPEAVFNHGQLSSMTGGKVTLEFKSDGSPYMEFLMREFRKYVRVNGGDVQKVLGANG